MRPHSSDDAEITQWARLAGRGDRLALDRFLRATQPHVWRFVAGLCDIQSADDLTQETYVRALGSLPRFRAESSARTWLLSIARRVVADHIRALRARPRPATLADWQTDAGRAESPEGNTFEERVLLDHLVTALEPDRRDAFVLTQALGLSHADAAAVCGCPVGTIRSRVARARDDLAAAMRDVPVRYSAVG
ncbi:sigma-70 family RNA polymerase sigma factor [Amycolatopsis sp. OK19-0408]|uniref:RNA polymerase sigma factor n=1 Tax=Amycolatopsis iheyensis TaxID=2945988 RepID=A0A9X2NPS2_9PSEU|nr:sigma-70 family RNA polymerase sigma factor [Amycolatopsis iheyensis]MCR6490712.1 sigma-70 family RNA polymerase sigma factor [Amycolatopsis iheyensis]